MVDPTLQLLDRAEIVRRVDTRVGLQQVRKSFIAYSGGRASMPPVSYLGFPQANGDCHVKCGYIHGEPIFAVKIATGFYDNPAHGLPSSNGLVVAISAHTGAPLALLRDEGYLTDLRTGLAGAIATQLMWPRNATRVGLVGTGTQARMQLRALRLAIPETAITVEVWGRSNSSVQALIADVADLGLPIHPCGSLEELCRNAQVIITTTPSTAPLVMDAWISPGTHITAVGADAPGKQELETSLVARATRLLADSREQSVDHGEFYHAVSAGLVDAQSIIEIGSVLASSKVAREDADISIADLTGLGVQDAAIAACALNGYSMRTT